MRATMRHASRTALVLGLLVSSLAAAADEHAPIAAPKVAVGDS